LDDIARRLMQTIEEYRWKRALADDPKERQRCNDEIERLTKELMEVSWRGFFENGGGAADAYTLILAQLQTLTERVTRLEQALDIEHEQRLKTDWSYGALRLAVVASFAIDFVFGLILFTRLLLR
jgi:hypothetical protein